MADREKVIEGIKKILSETDTYDGILFDAIALLKEQEAVKPKSKSRHGVYPQFLYRCGNCNGILYRHYKHCPTCGRSVKWE